MTRERQSEQRRSERYEGDYEPLQIADAETWRDAYERELRTENDAAWEHFIEFSGESFEQRSEAGQAAVERLEQCVVERDIDGLDAAADALGEQKGFDRLGELGMRLAALDDGSEREHARTLSRLWRNRLRDVPLAVRPEMAEELEVIAGAWSGRSKLGGDAGETLREAEHDAHIERDMWRGPAHESSGRVMAGSLGMSAAQAWFDPPDWHRTGALSIARLAEAAVHRLGYEPNEFPADESGYGAVREALRREVPDARALDSSAPLHVRLAGAHRDRGYPVPAALILEQASGGPCLDAPHESTLARVRGALVAGLDGHRRAREDCVRAIFSAARDALDPPGSRRLERRSLHPRQLAGAVGAMRKDNDAFAALVRRAHVAAAEPGVGHIESTHVRRALADAPLVCAMALAKAINHAQAATERFSGPKRQTAGRER